MESEWGAVTCLRLGLLAWRGASDRPAPRLWSSLET